MRVKQKATTEDHSV